MRKAKNGATYKTCVKPEGDKKPKTQVRDNPRVRNRKQPIVKAYENAAARTAAEKARNPPKPKKGQEGYVKKTASGAQQSALAKGRAIRNENVKAMKENPSPAQLARALKKQEASDKKVAAAAAKAKSAAEKAALKAELQKGKEVVKKVKKLKIMPKKEAAAPAPKKKKLVIKEKPKEAAAPKKKRKLKIKGETVKHSNPFFGKFD
tara:strand:- start:14848 stop:15465 length:618 start_codon:yes stop_codon:yes gene_type:complete